MSNREFSIQGMLQSGGKWGLYGGLIMIVFTASIYIFDINIYNIWFGLISFVISFGIAIVFMYKGAAGYRDELGPGRVDYLSALLALFFTGLLMYFISAFFSLLLNTVIDPEYHIKLFKQFEEFIANNQDIPESMKPQLLESTEENLNPMRQFRASLISSPVIALILSLIMAFFVRKSAKYQENL
jgi:hypothetical protein